MKMPFTDFPSPLLVLVGPTAVGKSDLAIQIAKRINGEIISADSRLFYREMDIGTAKPSLKERSEVPHFLIDVANPDQTLSLAVFQQEVYEIIKGIHARNHLPILVGGTGQYIRAVLESWQIPPQRENPRLRNVLQKWATQIGREAIHHRLAVIDPEAARSIDPRNVRRTIRAFEVIFMTGQRFSNQRRKTARRFSLLMIGLIRPRDELYKRIDARIDRMIQDGLVDEVKALLAKGYSPDLPSLSAIGYREIIRYVLGEITLEEAIMLIKRSTRRFVRRQANWFKPNDPLIHWFDMDENVIDRIADYVRSGDGWLPAESS